jgi:hypothetical protein
MYFLLDPTEAAGIDYRAIPKPAAAVDQGDSI